jgi:hypothetical protein
MNYTKIILENDINFETLDLNEIKEVFNFLEDPDIETETEQEQQHPEQVKKVVEDTFVPIINNIKLKNCDDFELFVNECCDINIQSDCSYRDIKNQYKIWCKTSNKKQIDKLIVYLKNKFESIKKNDMNVFRTKKDFFNGIKIKQEFYEFKDGDSIIEKFLFEKCKRAPGFQITRIDLLKEFENSEAIKNKIINYFDLNFSRCKFGDANQKKDSRLNGYLGLALKTENTPEPIIRKNKSNSKKVYYINITTKQILQEFDSQRDAADFFKISPALLNVRIKSCKQFDNCILSYDSALKM